MQERDCESLLMDRGEIPHLFLFSLCLLVLPQGSWCSGLLSGFCWLSGRRENRVEGLWSTWCGSEGAGRVWNGFPESFISRPVSGRELWIGGGLICSPQGLEVGVCSPHAVLNLFSWLQCTNSTERKQPPRLFSHSHTGFWIPVSCSQVALSFSLQRHMSCLSFPSEISSPFWRSLALYKPLHCTERAGWSMGPSDCTCGAAALVHTPLSSFLGYYQGLPTVLPASDSASTMRLKFPSEIPICWRHSHLKPFSGATLSMKSKVICVACRVL